MTAATVRAPAPATAEGTPLPRHRTTDHLAGTAALARFALRRDRIRLPAWLLGMTLLALWFGAFLSDLAASEEQRQDMRRFMEGGVGAVFGPGYGREQVSAEVYLAGVYGMIFFVLAGLMTLQLVARHTRAEEQAGRAELVRSATTGRHAPLTAVLLVAVGANGALALLLGGAMAANGYDGRDGLLFGASVGAVGLVFAGVAALSVQVTEHSRAASGIAGAALGGAWAVRAAGDMLADHGSLLSWFSPLAWSNQTRPYVDGRWWPLLLSGGLAAMTAGGGYALSARRDLGAGLVAARAGRAQAAPWLRSPLAAAYRLQRSGLAWWTASLAALGLMFGAFADQITDPANISEDRIEMFGGSIDTLVDGYLSVLTLLAAALAGVMVVQGVLAVRAEETSGRAEPVLATATSRTAWFGGYLAVLSVGLAGLLLVVGLVTGISAAATTGDGSYAGAMTAAHLAHVPGVLVVLGMASLLFGLLPRALGVMWAVVGYGLFATVFGTAMDHPQWARNLVPMEHTGQPPLDGIAWRSSGTLLVLAAVLVAAGVAGFRRRDLEAT